MSVHIVVRPRITYIIYSGIYWRRRSLRCLQASTLGTSIIGQVPNLLVNTSFVGLYGNGCSTKIDQVNLKL